MHPGRARLHERCVGMKAHVLKPCSGCGNCRDVCAFDAIFILETPYAKAPVIDPEKCTGCGVCEQICFEEAIKIG